MHAALVQTEITCAESVAFVDFQTNIWKSGECVRDVTIKMYYELRVHHYLFTTL